MHAREMALLQGAYWLVGGLWPVVSMRTFEAVTGRKTDRWLSKTMGLMMAAVGGCLLASARRGDPSVDLAQVAASTAAVVCGAGTFYAASGRISKMYLLDAVAEAILVLGWCRMSLCRSRGDAV